jgi:hypothetical protein
MRRRKLLFFAAGALVCPLLVNAQPASKKYRIAYVTVVARLDTDAYNKVMMDELRQLGYEEGKNLEMQRYSTEGSTEQRSEVALGGGTRKPRCNIRTHGSFDLECEGCL